MNNEIKEMNFTEMLFNRDERLLQYILNLQEEIDKLTAESTEWESKFYDLQEENEFINEELNNITDYARDLEIYKSRIDKAIEYITSEESINLFTSINAREKWLKINHKLLEILNGGDEE